MDDEICFEWDDANLGKLAAASRGITPELCEELARNDPKFYAETRAEKTGDHWMIAPDNDGRVWTVVVVSKGNGVLRPISGWPSTNRQVRLYYEQEETNGEGTPSDE